MPQFDKFNVNAELLGKVMVAKIRVSSNAITLDETNLKAKVQSSTSRPAKYDSISDWLKEINNINKDMEDMEKPMCMEMQDNIKYHASYINKKFAEVY